MALGHEKIVHKGGEGELEALASRQLSIPVEDIVPGFAAAKASTIPPPSEQGSSGRFLGSKLGRTNPAVRVSSLSSFDTYPVHHSVPEKPVMLRVGGRRKSRIGTDTHQRPREPRWEASVHDLSGDARHLVMDGSEVALKGRMVAVSSERRSVSHHFSYARRPVDA